MLATLTGSGAPDDFLFGELPHLIDSIGQPEFDASLLRAMNVLCGAEHVASYMMNDDNSMTGVSTASFVGTDMNYASMSYYVKERLWRFDPTYEQVRERLSDGRCVAIPTDVSRLPDRRLRETVYGRRGIKGRVFLCCRVQNLTIGLAVCASNDKFAAKENIGTVEPYAAAVFSALAKHISCSIKTNASLALTSLNEIEDCISEQMPEMPRREAQICSRAIYGVTSLGMALELNISQETVMTYRKRAYARLGIATLRELLLWYLDIWSSWPRRGDTQSRLH